MYVTGKTTDGLPIISGLFRFYDTLGVPLADVLMKISERRLVPDWADFIQSASTSGWTKHTTLSRVREAVVDSYGPKHWEGMCEQFNSHLDAVYGVNT